MNLIKKPPLYREIQKKNFTELERLLDFLEFDNKAKSSLLKSHHAFVLNLPVRLAQKIQKNCLDDPLFKQFVPMPAELEKEEGFSTDPLEEDSFLCAPKLLQKYEGRALLVTTSACAMHCRYCFRKNYPYEKQTAGNFDIEVDRIAKDESIQEVILSGGDPLSLNNESLRLLLHKLSYIPHVKLIRFHSRFIVGIPERVDKEFLSILEESPKQIIFVTHINHHLELDGDVFSALKSIQKLGIPTLNQSVLLQGVNDNFTALKTLHEMLTYRGVIPYYLHQLDPVDGTQHFQVKKEKGLQLIEELKACQPGYSVPRYVEELPHQKNKLDVTS